MNMEAEKQINEMLQKDVIQPSSSPWSSGIVMVQKKDGTKRFCVDYRRMNDVTIKDAYPLPRIDDSLDQLSGAEWFSSLDLNSGYWQVEVNEEDREKTAFASRQGLFEFKVMPFGLCNAPATFERLMEIVLAGLNWQVCLIYLDDVIVIGKTFENMIQNLDMVLQKMKDAGLKLKPRKCHLFAKEVEFLGHVITKDGIKTDPKKTKVVQDWPKPENVHEVRSFLGFCSYYRRFICKFAEIAKPLHKLSEKSQKFVWTEECSTAFETLKEKLVQCTILSHPDFKEPFVLDTDASDIAIGAVLSQRINGEERVVSFASRTLSKSERRYCVTRKELLAVVHFVKYFRHYLYGKEFTVRTDHGSLRWLTNFKNPEGQLARWLEVLSSYSMKIEHRPGRQHRNADGLSRIPCKQCGLTNSIEAEPAASVCTINVENNGENVKEIKEAQELDSDISKVRSWVEKGARPEHKAIACESYFIKSLWNQWPRLHLKDDLLVRKWDVIGTDIVYWQAVVPLSQRRNVLSYAHDIKASGHLGIRKTLGKIRQRFYWPGLQTDVRAYVNGCQKCMQKKDPTKTKTAPMQTVRSGYPMERLAVDILGEFPVTERGKKYILVLGDYFTKWTECFPMINMESETVAKIIINEVISRFGIPNTIHSDQGRQFESNLFHELCKLLQIQKTRTTPYHPQSDGMVERFNKTLAYMLSTLVSDNQRDWDELIPYVMMAYRSSEHETTGVSPNLLMLGRETSTPLDIVYEMPPSIKSIPTNQWVWELRERLESAHTMVRQFTGESIRRQKRYHDQKVSFEKFEAGDHVYVYFPVRKPGSSSKLTSYWRGPYQVSSKLSDVLYMVNCGRGNSSQVIHCDRLKKAKDQILTGEEVYQTPDIGETDKVTDTSIDHDGEEVTPEDMVRQRRIRKKPVWLQDYVLSAFRSTMPQTKTTPRKNNIICPVCKESIQRGETFSLHIVKCTETRIECKTCGQTFKKSVYLQRHLRTQHGNQDPSAMKSSENNTAKENILSKSFQDSDNESDFDPSKEPDVYLSETDHDDELAVGRITRKPTTPLPVPAPKKKKSENVKTGHSEHEVETEARAIAAVSQEDIDIDKFKEPQNDNSDQGNKDTQGEEDTIEQGHEIDKKGIPAQISFEIKNRFVSEGMSIKDKDETVFSVFSKVRDGQARVQSEINVGDYLARGACVKAEDMTIKRILSKDGGKVELHLKYSVE